MGNTSSDAVSTQKLHILREHYQYYDKRLAELHEQYLQHLTKVAGDEVDELAENSLFDQDYQKQTSNSLDKSLARNAAYFAQREEILQDKRQKYRAFLIKQLFNIDLEYGLSDDNNIGLGFRRKLYDSSIEQASYYLDSQSLYHKMKIWSSRSTTCSLQHKLSAEQDLQRNTYSFEQSFSIGRSGRLGKFPSFSDYRLGWGHIINHTNYVTFEFTEGCHLTSNLILMGQASTFITLDKPSERLNLSKYQLSLVYKLPIAGAKVPSKAFYTLQLGISQDSLSYGKNRSFTSQGILCSIWISMF